MKTAQEYYNSGLAKEESQQFESAIEDFTEAIKYDGNNADYYNHRGIVKHQLKDYKGAIEDFDKAIQLNPKVGKIYGNRGKAKNKLGDEAGAYDDRVLELKIIKDSKKQEFLNSISTIIEDKDNQKSERELILAAVTKHGIALEYVNDELKSDREIVLAAVSNYGRALNYAADELKSDREIVLAAVSNYGRALNYAAEELKSDREIVLAAVSNYGIAFHYCDDNFKSDREIVLAAVSNYGSAIHYCDDNFKSDREIVLAAVSNYGSALEHTTKELKSDREIVLAAVTNDGSALEYADEELKNDREIVLAALLNEGGALKYASEELKRDREVVLAAVYWGNSPFFHPLNYAANELLCDRKFVLALVKKNESALEYADDLLYYDREFVLTAVKVNHLAFHYCNDNFKSDREIVLATVSKYGTDLKYAAKELKSDREIVLAAVTNDGSALEYAAEELKSDKEIVLAAVTNDGSALEYAAEELKSDRKFVLTAVTNVGSALKYAAEELKSDREIVLAAVKINHLAFHYCDDNFKSDREIVLAAVSKYGTDLKYAAKELKSDREIVLAAVTNDGRALKHASYELKSDENIDFAAIIEKSATKKYTYDKLIQNFKIEIKNDLYGLVNKATNVNVVDYLYDYISIVKHHHDLSLINNSYIYLLETGKSNLAHICYYNQQTQNISISNNQFYTTSIKFFYNGKAICANKNGWFVVDLNGEVVIGPEDSAEDMWSCNNFNDRALARCFDIYNNTNGLGINYGFPPDNSLFNMYMLHTDEEWELFNADNSTLHLEEYSAIWGYNSYSAISSFEYETGTCLIKGGNGKVALMNRYFHRITDWFDEFYERENFTGEQGCSIEDWNEFCFRKGDERYIFKVIGNFVEDIIKRPFLFFEYPDVAERIIENDMFKYNTENIDSNNYLKYDKIELDLRISKLNPEVEITNELLTEIKQSQSYIDEIIDSLQLLNSNKDTDLFVIDEKIRNHNRVFGIIPSKIELLSIEKL